MDQEYKLRKEAFVANLSGGSITEINLVTLVAPVGFFDDTTCRSTDQEYRPRHFYGRRCSQGRAFFNNMARARCFVTSYSMSVLFCLQLRPIRRRLYC